MKNDQSQSLFSRCLGRFHCLKSKCCAAAQHMRKNIYEEALFRSEDDRFELDMVIECGASAIRAMAPLVAQLALLPPDAKANWRLPPVRRCTIIVTFVASPRAISEKSPAPYRPLPVAIASAFMRILAADNGCHTLRTRLQGLWLRLCQCKI